MKPTEESNSPDVFPDLHGEVPVGLAAEEQAIEHFATWLDVELEKLVARWSHLAAPKAGRSSTLFACAHQRS